MVVNVVNGGNGSDGESLILLLLLVNIPLFCRSLKNSARLRKTMGYLSFFLSLSLLIENFGHLSISFFSILLFLHSPCFLVCNIIMNKEIINKNLELFSDKGLIGWMDKGNIFECSLSV